MNFGEIQKGVHPPIPHMDPSLNVHQGRVSYGIFFVVYIVKVLMLFCKSGPGCLIHGIFFDVVICDDDIFLLRASRTGIQEVVKILGHF